MTLMLRASAAKEGAVMRHSPKKINDESICFIAIPLHDNPAVTASAATQELTSDLAYICAAPPTGSARGCHPCLRYSLLPMCPGRTRNGMARSEGFEPPALGIEIRCSIQLS